MPTTDPEPGTLFAFGIPGDGTPVFSKEIRDCLQALAQNHYTTDGAFPKAARKGQFRINAEDPNNIKFEVALEIAGGLVWQTLLQGLQLGFAAPSQRVVQIVNGANVWPIDHNLGKQPLVLAYDAQGFQFGVVGQGIAIGAKQCSIQHATVNRVIITHQAATTPTGFVVLIG